MGSADQHSVPIEARQVFEKGILQNPLMTSSLIGELKSLSEHVRFEGSPRPIIPVNWRFAESISAIKAFEATMLNLLLTRKYQIDPVDILINT